jgi:hypothetical protein
MDMGSSEAWEDVDWDEGLSPMTNGRAICPAKLQTGYVGRFLQILAGYKNAMGSSV